MSDFAETHTAASRDGVRVHGTYRWTDGLSCAVTPPHFEPVAVCDWSLAGESQLRAGAALAEAMGAYVEGALALAEVKVAYQAFAAAHLVWWVGGRMFYTEGAARLCVEEVLHEWSGVAEAAAHTAPVAHPVGGEAGAPTRPRLAYSRRGD